MLDPMRLKERLDAHFADVGRFMQAFAQVETLAQVALVHALKKFQIQQTDPFGVPPLGKTINGIRAAHKDAGQPMPNRLSKALSKIEEISRHRNTLAHNGAQFGEHFTSMASRRDLALNKPDATVIDALTFTALREDLETIQACFLLYFLDGSSALPSIQEMADDLGLGQRCREMLDFLGITEMSGADVLAAAIDLAERDWQFRPVRTVGAPRNILAKKPRRPIPRRRKVI